MAHRKAKSLKTLSNYLNRFALYPPFHKSKAYDDTGLFVVIPAYNESDLMKAVQSICHQCPPERKCELIVVLNSSETDTDEIRQLHKEQLKQLNATSTPAWLSIVPVLLEFVPKKKAGVGLARKVGMDEAIRRLVAAELTDGVLICYDADCLCSKNYLQQIEQSFFTHGWNIASVYFEHQVTAELPEWQQNAIIEYELFLRYYKNALAYAVHPQAHFTVGSSMAVSAVAYVLQGGMNTRKAGEDFYFFNKVSLLGSSAEVNSCAVYPSARISTRVPFGTGKAMQSWKENQWNHYPTYAIATFQHLKRLVESAKALIREGELLKWAEEPLIQQFLGSEKVEAQLRLIENNTASKEQQKQKFFQWFDGFMVLKFCHFYRDSHEPLSTCRKESKKLAALLQLPIKKADNAQTLLSAFRNFDRKTTA